MLVLASGHAAGYVVFALLLPILSRLYQPADFGVLGIYTAALGVLGLFATMRYDAAIPLPSRDETALGLVAVALGISVAFALALGLAVLTVGAEPLSHFGMGLIRPYLAILIANVFVMGCYQTLTFWAVRRNAFLPLARMKFTLTTVVPVSQVVAGGLVAGSLGLVLGQLLGYVAAVIAMLVFLRIEWWRARPWRATEARAAARGFLNFPFFALPAELALVLTTALPPVFLNAHYTPEVVGWFMLAWRAVATPLTLLVVPVARVYLAAAAEAVLAGPGSLERLFLRTVLKLAVLGTPPVAALGAVAPWLFVVVFGPRWVESGYYCRILCPMLLCHMISVSVRPTFDVLHKQFIHVVASVVGVLLVTAGLVVPHFLHVSPMTAVGILSLCGSCGHVFALGLTWLVLRRFSREAALGANLHRARR